MSSSAEKDTKSSSEPKKGGAAPGIVKDRDQKTFKDLNKTIVDVYLALDDIANAQEDKALNHLKKSFPNDAESILKEILKGYSEIKDGILNGKSAVPLKKIMDLKVSHEVKAALCNQPFNSGHDKRQLIANAIFTDDVPTLKTLLEKYVDAKTKHYFWIGPGINAYTDEPVINILLRGVSTSPYKIKKQMIYLLVKHGGGDPTQSYVFLADTGNVTARRIYDKRMAALSGKAAADQKIPAIDIKKFPKILEEFVKDEGIESKLKVGFIDLSDKSTAADILKSLNEIEQICTVKPYGGLFGTNPRQADWNEFTKDFQNEIATLKQAAIAAPKP